MTTLRAGISGCGKLGRAIVQQVRTHAYCDIIAAHDPDAAALQQFAAHTGIKHCSSEFEAMLASGVDFVILAGPCGVRPSQVALAAEQGVHCVLHAPMAPDATAAAAMVEACDRTGIKLGVAAAGFDDPVLEQVRRMIAADWLGGIVCVQAIWAEDPLLTSPPTASGRMHAEVRDAIFLLASHHVHLASWVTGRSALTVTAQSARGFLPLASDTTVATAKLRGNVLCTFLASHLTRARVFAIHGTDGGVRIAGDRIWLLGRTEFRGEVFDYLRPGEEQVVTRAELQLALRAQAPGCELHGRFARWIDDCDDFPCPAEEALHTMRVLDAIARAASSGKQEAV